LERKFDALPPRRILLVLLSILLWAGVLLALIYFNRKDNAPKEHEQIFGSLDGRFESSVTMVHDGKTLHYRENEITNFLVIGLDQESVHAQTGHQNGGQADFMMVLSIDRIKRSITPIMLDRDVMCEVQTYGVFGNPSGTRVMQLCLAQNYSGSSVSGSENTVNAVEKLLSGIKIHHYVLLDLGAVPTVNDAVGGVEVTLYDDFTAFDPAMKEGETLLLSGEQAAFFVRGRMTVADGSNASRMSRQQQYLSSLLVQFRRNLKGNQGKLMELLDAMEDHMISDAADGTLLNTVNAYDDYEWNAMRTIVGEHKTDQYGFAEFWADEAALHRLVADVWFK